ncbi:hypothetical protein EVU96_09420 [Bacillus infantis]|uniref:hypothetical protein n=1 Tax=Bacillus infantis TaxID=324767 RepID=UPI00101CA8E4|nr:hypothetical protein [Bacillus infantis]RYI30625.1 hypothetical protein EVU96_09420 [Bacillus infantis]
MTKIQISCHDEKTFVAEVAEFNAETLAEKINNHQITVLAIGDTIISKNIIKTIVPVVEEA